MTFKTLLPGAWELKQDVSLNLFALHVPTAWRQVAATLAHRRANAQGRRTQAVPVRSLDSLVTASFPKIVHAVRGGGWQRADKPWLLATEPMSSLATSALPSLIKNWLSEEFHSLGEAEVAASLAALNDEEWNWETESKSYSLLHPNTEDEENLLYSAIPDYLAQEFLQQTPVVSFNGKRLRFYRIVRLQGAELMSWPPSPVIVTNFIDGEEKTERTYLSFVLRFVLQTVPWRNSPVIYHQLSVRRWIIEPLQRVPFRGMTTYVGNQLRLIDGVQQPLCFIPLPLNQWQGEAWPRAISELLADDSILPKPTDLLQNPTYNWNIFGRNPNATQASIPYSSKHRGDLLISLPGASPLDLACIDQAIKEHLPVRRVGEAVLVAPRSYKHIWFSPELQKPRTPILHRKIIAPALFYSNETPLKTILLLWETPQCRDALVDEICKLLSLSPRENIIPYETRSGAIGEARLYQGEFGSLWIKTQFVEGLTQNFAIQPSIPIRDRKQQRNTFMDQRINDIIQSLPEIEELSGAIIEIPPKATFPREADPKLAIRIGAAQAGYLNQHIHAVTYTSGKNAGKPIKSGAERVKRAVTDLLRQFGILPPSLPLINPEKDGIDPHTWLVCFHAIRRTKRTTASNLPNTVVMMIRVNPVEFKVEATTPRLSQNGSNYWVSYPEALKQLLNEKWDVNAYSTERSEEIIDDQQFTEKQREERLLNKFVSDCLRDCLHTSLSNDEKQPPHVLFMVEAQNARQSGMLSWLQNPKLPANELPKALSINGKEKERLWVVRLRKKGSSDEVPVAIAKSSPGSRASGLYHWQGICEDNKELLYLSVRKPLTTDKYPLLRTQSRLDHGNKAASNARLLEIAIIHSPGIQPAKLARFVHLLRGRWAYFADDVALPLPFPLATKAAEEYAVSARDLPNDSQVESKDSE
jgi:hypothetical protein